MPLSISNSSSRAPAGPWLATWALALVLAGGALYKMEIDVREKGHIGSIRDTPALWTYHRGRVSNGRRHTVALLGASRMQLGFSTRQFRQEFPNYVTSMLAIDGTAPVGSLRDLAADPDFRGVAIVSMTTSAFYKRQWNSQDQYIRYFHNGFMPGAYINTFMDIQIQKHMVLRTAGGTRALGSWLAYGRWPDPIYVTTWADRSRSADYRKIDIEAHREKRVAPIRRRMPGARKADFDAWFAEAKQVEPFVKAIRRRGGHVVFVRFPTTDEHLAYSLKTHPKEAFWDRFAAYTQATTIHFLDYPQLAHFDCPDTSHLDRRDAPAFTSALADILAKKGILERPPP